MNLSQFQPFYPKYWLFSTVLVDLVTFKTVWCRMREAVKKLRHLCVSKTFLGRLKVLGKNILKPGSNPMGPYFRSTPETSPEIMFLTKTGRKLHRI